MGSVAWKVLAAGSGIVAGLVATKLVDAAWSAAGQDKVGDPKNPQSPAKQAIVYAALSGLAVAAAQTFATRKAAAYYEKSAGHLPKPFVES
ncbi:MAG: DUF4235 domain-containing protein [Nostocoides sp.]